MGLIEVVRCRICNISRVLGALWICQCNLDTGGIDQLEPGDDPELRFRGYRLRIECLLPREESMACGQRDRGKGEQGPRHWDGPVARRIGYCHKVHIFRVSHTVTVSLPNANGATIDMAAQP